ncbi:histone-lysine N-methyltransferase SETD1B-like [Fundulus heteroclitus]|uniref:histone-lysine N-methyltransferase SETD1B-like n=1 Tax=Fundulus heteroclitus TaxID=8078 RepID=UPI00165C9410|nr:histone-lysine N-methyltransferase SETD1B-like [Fundulus heteroclitus]
MSAGPHDRVFMDWLADFVHIPAETLLELAVELDLDLRDVLQLVWVLDQDELSQIVVFTEHGDDSLEPPPVLIQLLNHNMSVPLQGHHQVDTVSDDEGEAGVEGDEEFLQVNIKISVIDASGSEEQEVGEQEDVEVESSSNGESLEASRETPRCDNSLGGTSTCQRSSELDPAPSTSGTRKRTREESAEEEPPAKRISHDEEEEVDKDDCEEEEEEEEDVEEEESSNGELLEASRETPRCDNSLGGTSTCQVSSELDPAPSTSGTRKRTREVGAEEEPPAKRISHDEEGEVDVEALSEEPETFSISSSDGILETSSGLSGYDTMTSEDEELDEDEDDLPPQLRFVQRIPPDFRLPWYHPLEEEPPE